MKKKVFVGLGVLAMGMVIGGVILDLKKEKPILSPLAKRMGLIIEKKAELKVFGFLPTWMIGKTQEYCREINRLVFLGVETNAKGELIWDVQSKKINNAEYVKSKEKIKKCGGKNILGIKLFDDEKLKILMADPEAKKNLVEETKTAMTAGGFDGLNVDFEYQGDPTAVIETEVLTLLSSFKEAGVGELGLDVFANTIIKGDGEKLKQILGVVDDLIVMAYDFHRPGMDFAGPVAPIGSPTGERNISEIFQKVEEVGLDKGKIIMAYPLYGYEWRTETEDIGSATVNGWGQMVSFARAKGLEENLGGVKLFWDEISQTPWLTYKEERQVTKTTGVGKKRKTVTTSVTDIYQAYYENEKSLKIKVDLVKEKGYGGVGFWALGYEGENKDVWKIVKEGLE
jgi:spore germination protein YaaH